MAPRSEKTTPRRKSARPKLEARPKLAARSKLEARDAEIRLALDRVRRDCDVEARLELDPVGAVHRYQRVLDRELVGLMASAVAFGNVRALRAKLEDALSRLGPDIARVADDPSDVATRLSGWKHRVYRAEDLTGLLVGARNIQRRSGSLGKRFASDLREASGDLRAALGAFTSAIREAGGLAERREHAGARHILADPKGASACKRLLLYLRWMIRPADGIDLGLWDIPASALLIPVDTHIHKLSQNLGFTRRKDLSWKTAEEVTSALRRFDASDPTKYDFALCHLGMLQRCPARRDVKRCEGCGVLPICRHWATGPRPAGAG
jgi:uncharacterized protein (TIGR02757 family)